MKRFICYSVLSLVTISLNGCGNNSNTEAHATELCNCVKEIGIDKSFRATDLADWEEMRSFERKASRILPECALVVMRKIEKEIADLSKTEKKEYTKSLAKAVIDTDCSDFILDQVPFDMMGIAIGELEKEVERSKKRQYQDMF